MKLDVYFAMLFPILFGIMAILFFAVGLRGIKTKRPFLISERWLFSIVLVGSTPVILQSFLFSLPSIMIWLSSLLFGCILLMMWHQKGYMAFAVTNASFREALLASLEKLQLTYEESFSLIRLTSIRLTSAEADLQVSVQSWKGSAQIKVKQNKHRPLLREIVNAMNEYFRTSPVHTNMISCAFYAVMGVFMVIFAIGMLFFGTIL